MLKNIGLEEECKFKKDIKQNKKDLHTQLNLEIL